MIGANVLSRAGRALVGMRLGSTRFCHADLPRAGLGNKMLVWARAIAFARHNDLPVFISGWGQLKVGPLLRGERHARLYFGYFEDPNSIAPPTTWLLRRTPHQIAEPELERLPPPDGRITAYVFHQPPHWSDYFKGVHEYRELVRRELQAIVSKSHRDELARLSPPVVGIHIRHGDFRVLKPGEDYKKVGHARTPIGHFRRRILALRGAAGHELPVTIFSDGRDEDLAEVLSLPGVHRAQTKSDIVDLLHLAQSRVIVTATGSTFGLWAGFLADAPVLHDPDHFHAHTRPPSVNERWYEGPAAESPETWPPLLLDNLRAIPRSGP